MPSDTPTPLPFLADTSRRERIATAMMAALVGTHREERTYHNEGNPDPHSDVIGYKTTLPFEGLLWDNGDGAEAMANLSVGLADALIKALEAP